MAERRGREWNEMRKRRRWKGREREGNRVKRRKRRADEGNGKRRG